MTGVECARNCFDGNRVYFPRWKQGSCRAILTNNVKRFFHLFLGDKKEVRLIIKRLKIGIPPKRISKLPPKTTAKKNISSLKEIPKPNRKISNHTTDPENGDALVGNAVRLLECTTLCPFRVVRGCLQCALCASKFSAVDELRSHWDANHGQMPGVVTLKKLCSTTLSKFSEVVLRLDVTVSECKLCGFAGETVASLLEHLRREHGKETDPARVDNIIPYNMRPERGYRCAVCEERFPAFLKLDMHMNQHFQNHVCEVCAKPFAALKRMEVHTRVHNVGSYACKHCGKLADTLSKLVSHERGHQRTLHTCHTCNEQFKSYVTRNKHMDLAHGSGNKYDCPLCSLTFHSNFQKSMHIRRHHLQDRKYSCEHCLYQCYSMTQLKDHMSCHLDRKDYACKFCGKAYARKRTLREHLKIHNNVRKFVCPACAKAFVQKCSLKGHIKTHHPELSTKNDI